MFSKHLLLLLLYLAFFNLFVTGCDSDATERKSVPQEDTNLEGNNNTDASDSNNNGQNPTTGDTQDIDTSNNGQSTDTREPYVPATSRLDNITATCGNIMPAPISGGQKGWGSRYWDCCKPHCSWDENTPNLAANCDVNGDEIPCFVDSPNNNEYWSGTEGTKSGCDADGIAYMCYSHVPFAMCENLAYGFAAVPSTEDSCGKCFQLDFDGGFEHGDPKPAHRLMQGKTMIVMASNIGHDVGGGQFDIMIPGGGLGAFTAGCEKQWNVDVNNEALVGKTFGGFTTTCQESLGWDAPPETIKSCVQDMCDTLFGDKPALNDLWEGCTWYVRWMNAVDNPTFSYQQVPCPKELEDLYYSAFH
jgi:hypothetical protein